MTACCILCAIFENIATHQQKITNISVPFSSQKMEEIAEEWTEPEEEPPVPPGRGGGGGGARVAQGPHVTYGKIYFLIF